MITDFNNPNRPVIIGLDHGNIKNDSRMFFYRESHSCKALSHIKKKRR